VTTGQIVTASSVSYGNAPNNMTFFGGGASISEFYVGDFYWIYVSTETLTDSEIKKVIAYNEGTAGFETDVTAITASYSSTTCAVTLTAEEDMDWTASTNDSWITVSPVSGTGSATITISVSQNKTYISRTGSVEITNGEDTIEIECTQEKYPLFIPAENIYRADLEVVKACRSGSTINKAYRSGNLIYQKLNPVEEESGYYLTFEVFSGGTIVWKKNYNDAPTRTIQYSLNNGNWVSITASDTAGTAINVSQGDIVRIKGTNNSYATSSYNYCNFDGTAKYYAYGNVMSLIYGEDFIGQKTIEAEYAFAGLFLNASGMTNHNTYKLVLPATTLAAGCYQGMFQNNQSLRRAPELPATVLVGSCYRQMFYNCNSLNYIKCLATDISASSCLSQWVSNVASTGVFAKNPSMSDWPTGVIGIPSGWTVVNA
jgi:hypothetical protein